MPAIGEFIWGEITVSDGFKVLLVFSEDRSADTFRAFVYKKKTRALTGDADVSLTEGSGITKSGVNITLELTQADIETLGISDHDDHAVVALRVEPAGEPEDTILKGPLFIRAGAEKITGRTPSSTAITIGTTTVTVTPILTTTNQPLTTKGDLVVHDGTSNVRLPVGTDGQLVVADSVEASGLNYVTGSVFAATLLSLTYTYDQTTTESDPGAGNVRFDNSDPLLAAKFFISAETEPGAVAQPAWDALHTGDFVNFTESGRGNKGMFATVTGEPVKTVETGPDWYSIAISPFPATDADFNDGKNIEVGPFPVRMSAAIYDAAAKEEQLMGEGDVIPQAEAEAGMATTPRIVSAERMKQAIDALGGGDFSDGGDVAGANRTLGNTDAFDLSLLVNDIQAFILKSGAPANSLFIAADGKVGVGTALPGNELTVSGLMAATQVQATTVYRLGGENVITFDGTALELGTRSGSFFQSIDMYIASTVVLTIDSSAQVGIGTSTLVAGLSMGDDLLIARDVNAGITASTTQTQGQQPLTAEFNEVSTVANTNDTVTLITAVAGLEQTIFNNGANTLQIFPASGDNLGAGVDTATTLAAGSTVRFAAYDVTNWRVV